MSELPEHICHNLETLHENLLHYNPVVGRLIQLAEQLDFGRWPSQESGPLAVEGGLAIHSVETAMVMMKLHRALDPRMQEIPPYSVMLVGLFHDIGKCGVEKYPHWEEVPGEEETRWQVTHMAKTQGHALLGVSLFERAGVPLSKEELEAVLGHSVSLNGRRPGQLETLLYFANAWANARHREDENEHDGEGCPAMARGEHPSA